MLEHRHPLERLLPRGGDAGGLVRVTRGSSPCRANSPGPLPPRARASPPCSAGPRLRVDGGADAEERGPGRCAPRGASRRARSARSRALSTVAAVAVDRWRDWWRLSRPSHAGDPAGATSADASWPGPLGRRPRRHLCPPTLGTTPGTPVGTGRGRPPRIAPPRPRPATSWPGFTGLPGLTLSGPTRLSPPSIRARRRLALLSSSRPVAGPADNAWTDRRFHVETVHSTLKPSIPR